MESLSLAQLVERLGEELWKPGSHRGNVISFILEANEILLGRRFRWFEQADLKKIQDTLQRGGNSAATINRKTMALSKLLRAALKAGLLDSVPEFRKLEEPPERIRFLSHSEERSIFNHLRVISAEYHDLSVVLVDTGAKIGEIIELQWADISVGAETICLSRGKGQYERTIPITTRVAAVLSRIDRGGADGPFARVEQYKYRAAWNEAKVQAGLGADENVVPYVLRHTCASRLVKGGVDLRRVQLWLGHRTMKMTMRYDYLSTNDLDICASVLNARAQE